MKCLELFTGAGGLALGIGEAGFSHVGLIEFDHDSCETIRFNQTLPDSRVAGHFARSVLVTGVGSRRAPFPGTMI